MEKGVTEAIKDHLLEIISDNWGMTLSEIERSTGMQRRMLQKSLGAMAAENLVRLEGGRYVAR